MKIPPLYIASAITVIILIVVLIKLLPSKETPEFIEIEEDDTEVLPILPAVISIYLVPQSPISGKELLAFFMDHQLQFSETQKIFTSVSDGDEIFYAATLASPGIFDINTMIDDQFQGLSFFMQPATSKTPLDDFDALCLVLFEAKEIFNAHLQSDDKSEISLDQLREIREQISQLQNT